MIVHNSHLITQVIRESVYGVDTALYGLELAAMSANALQQKNRDPREVAESIAKLVAGVAMMVSGTADILDEFNVMPRPPIGPSLDMCFNASFCQGNLKVPRTLMPQIDGSVKEKFLENMAYVLEWLPTRYVNFTQGEINGGKVMRIVNTPAPGVFDEPYILSKDGFILDGHHRLAAMKHLCETVGTQCQIYAAVIGMTMAELLGKALHFPGVRSGAGL